MEKMTYVKALETVLVSAEMSVEVREKLEALKASLEKRSAAKSTKETKAQRETREFTESVYQTLMTHEEAVQCGELAKEMEVSSQKVSAALRKLVVSGMATKAVEKGVALFSGVEAE